MPLTFIEFDQYWLVVFNICQEFYQSGGGLEENNRASIGFMGEEGGGNSTAEAVFESSMMGPSLESV